MGIATSILITLGVLAAYYVGMIAYDLYLDKLSQASNDDEKEEAVDISDQAQDFKAIRVNKEDEKDETRNRFENLLRAGITAEKASRMMNSLADGNPAKELESVMYIIQDFQASTNNI